MLARSSSLVVLALVIGGCPKSSPPSVPSWDEGGGDQDGVMAAHDPDPASDDAGPADATDPVATDTQGTDFAAEGGSEPSTTLAQNDPPKTDPATPDPAKTEPAPPAEKPPLELPKPKHTKIDDSCGKDAGLGTKLKSFDLETVDGKKTTNKSFKGKVVLVNFWGTWCKPCLKELPEFDQLYRRYRKHGLALVAIATDEDPQPVKEFIDSRKISAKVLIGAEDYAGEYGSPKFPFSFVVDDKGVIKASYRGYRPECMGKLEADVRKQLEARAAK